MGVREPQFSEGPWTHDRGELFARDITCIATVWPAVELEKIAEVEANAALLLNAPKLFFALRAFVEAVEQSDSDVVTAFGAELEAGRQALAIAAPETADPRAEGAAA